MSSLSERQSQPVRAGSEESMRLGGRSEVSSKASSFALVHDLLLEHQIKRLGEACARAQKAGDRQAASDLWNQMRDAIANRSPAQIALMEDRLGLRIRQEVKTSLILGFVHSWIPAVMVAVAFRLLGLKGA